MEEGIVRAMQAVYMHKVGEWEGLPEEYPDDMEDGDMTETVHYVFYRIHEQVLEKNNARDDQRTRAEIDDEFLKLILEVDYRRPQNMQQFSFDLDQARKHINASDDLSDAVAEITTDMKYQYEPPSGTGSESIKQFLRAKWAIIEIYFELKYGDGDRLSLLNITLHGGERKVIEDNPKLKSLPPAENRSNPGTKQPDRG